MNILTVIHDLNISARANNLAFERWAETHTLTRVYFGWGHNGTQELTLQDCTYNQALDVAQQWGYREPCWYRPGTWFNWVVTVG